MGEGTVEKDEKSSAKGSTSAETKRAADAAEGDAQSNASSDDDEPQGESSGSPGAASSRSSDIDLPDFEILELEGDEVALERAGGAEARRAHPIAGTWEQFDGPRDADFGPGGYERSILMLNPTTKVAAVYRSFRGSLAIVMGGELALDTETSPSDRKAGTMTLRTDPSLASRFPASRVPLGGDPPRFAEPPTGSSPWTLSWKREGPELMLGDRRFRPITRERFEEIRRGGGDPATPADLAEKAPARPKGTGGKGGDGAAPKETAFFGVIGGGKRFVFIVDVSGSMQGPKLDRLKLELEQSIVGLPADADFSIVFFSSGAQVIDQTWMQAGRDTQRAVDLIRVQNCGGGTDPTQAFQFAFSSLSPLPDCIFFMTDGQIPPHTPDLVRSLNSGRVPTVIHSIGFGEPGDEAMIRPLLEQIAVDNKGKYEFVTP